MGDYATAQEVRDHPAFEGVGSPTDDRIDAVMTAVERRIEGERATGVAWVPRTDTDTVPGSGTNTVQLRRHRCRSLTSVTIDGEAISDLSGWKLFPSGRLKRPTGVFPRGAIVEVTYEHGHDAPPLDLKNAAIRVACSHIAQIGNPRVGPRTDTIDFGDGPTISFAEQPDVSRGRVFGMPDEDATIAGLAEPKPVIA